MKSITITFTNPADRKLGVISRQREDLKLEQEKKWIEEDREKLFELCRHFGIDESQDMFYQLSLTLARLLFPQKKKAGARRKWTELNSAVLVVEVERLVVPGDEAKGVSWACTQLSKCDHWKELLGEGQDAPESLRKHYYSTKGDIVSELMRASYHIYQSKNQLSEWSDHVVAIVKNSNLD